MSNTFFQEENFFLVLRLLYAPPDYGPGLHAKVYLHLVVKWSDPGG